MSVGKQSTLNDLNEIDEVVVANKKAIAAINAEMDQRGVSKRMQSRTITDMHEFFENGRFAINLVRGMANKPPRSKAGAYNWFYCDMKVHPHSNGYALTEVTEYFRDRKYFRRQSGIGANVKHGSWVEFLTTANTIIDSNGFIKNA